MFTAGKRPEPNFQTNATTRRLRLVTWMLVPLHIAIMLPGVLTATEDVPVHWDIDGTVTRYGAPWELLIVSGVFGALVVGLLLVSHRPQWFNYITVVTKTNAQEIYREGERLMVWMALVVAGMQGVVAWVFALGLHEGIAFTVTMTLVLTLLVVVGIGIVRQVRL
ncbi:hypothetical protein [uncultured Agrococcus sp.]|uniref:hypothetical protein n=1 Tax=uncultured Agrococcus sp. TaxID=382258 RepID=UPI0026010D7A|nr:hypothetical protein [uncultured Agrococcus sp.]